MRAATVLLAATLALGHWGQCQSVTSAEIPARNLKFEKGDAVPGLSISPVVVIPAQCTSDGVMYLDTLKPTDPRDRTVVAIGDKKSRSFSASGIGDLHDVTFISFFPTSSTVAFLVRATKEASTEERIVTTSEGSSVVPVSKGEYRYYIAKFDSNGNYKGYIVLPPGYAFSRIAILSSGDFLVSGYDGANATARVLRVSSNGDPAGVVALPPPMLEGAPSGLPDSPESLMASARMMSTILFTPYRDSVLLWRIGSKGPILEVSAGGGVREVSIQAPPGAVLADLLPATDRWVGHFRSPGVAADSSSPVETFNGDSYYEINPGDGGLTSRLTQSGEVPGTISCESDGTFLAFETDADRHFFLLSAR